MKKMFQTETKRSQKIFLTLMLFLALGLNMSWHFENPSTQITHLSSQLTTGIQVAAGGKNFNVTNIVGDKFTVTEATTCSTGVCIKQEVNVQLASDKQTIENLQAAINAALGSSSSSDNQEDHIQKACRENGSVKEGDDLAKCAMTEIEKLSKKDDESIDEDLIYDYYKVYVRGYLSKLFSKKRRSQDAIEVAIEFIEDLDELHGTEVITAVTDLIRRKRQTQGEDVLRNYLLSKELEKSNPAESFRYWLAYERGSQQFSANHYWTKEKLLSNLNARTNEYESEYGNGTYESLLPTLLADSYINPIDNLVQRLLNPSGTAESGSSLGQTTPGLPQVSTPATTASPVTRQSQRGPYSDFQSLMPQGVTLPSAPSNLGPSMQYSPGFSQSGSGSAFFQNNNNGTSGRISGPRFPQQ